MVLSIKDSEADRLARELADKTGESITDAVRTAIEERLARVRMRHRGRCLADDLDEIAERCARLPVVDDRSADDILGYGKNGLPQ
ncbi:MAG: type II toxin-antitoxin system VapB family antitoxin [Pseudomonadota bacterium]|nr:type II toxin-antitoxin system VapB family antitoxin [Pseudomonadota bacterium]